MGPPSKLSFEAAIDTLQLFNEIESIICDILYCDMRLIRM